MGQAKLKKLVGAYPDTSRIDTVTRATRAVARVAADRPLDGRDCVYQSKLLSALLNHHGIVARVAVGHVIWRVGAGVADVIAHNPGTYIGPPTIADRSGFEGHAWVEIADFIVDSTSYQWAQKLEQLGLVNGCKPKLDWPQDVLVLKPGRLKKSLDAVLRARTFAAHYQALDDFKPVLDCCDVPPEDLIAVQCAFAALQPQCVDPA
jgi:hypothetical protein